MSTFRLYRTPAGALVETAGVYHVVTDAWDDLVNHADLPAYLAAVCAGGRGTPHPDGPVLAPIGTQEVWGAGVTYERSWVARMEESKRAGSDTFYDRVYDAERPELFFKAAGWRVRGPGESIRVRDDARWSVPEPEIALCINARGEIVGATIGNDVSSRDIEGENPLYLPQAKIYDGSCALGPCLLVSRDPLPSDTPIALTVIRDGQTIFSADTSFARMRRDPRTLVTYLYRETAFPHGAFLLTGTGIVPPDDFSLQPRDTVRMHVPPIGTLINQVAAA